MKKTIDRNTTEIYVIRHGETTLSPMGQYIGSTDIPLSEHGKEQVSLLAKRLQSIHFDACYCSIMRRCQETARIIAAPHCLEIIPVAELREIDYGDWETLTTAEMQAGHPELYAAWKADPGSVHAPNGESGKDVLCRVRPAMEKIASKHLGQRILLIAHRTVNRIWLCHLLGYPLSSYRQAVGQDLTALNIVTYTAASKTEKNNFFSVELLNNTSHLAV